MNMSYDRVLYHVSTAGRIGIQGDPNRKVVKLVGDTYKVDDDEDTGRPWRIDYYYAYEEYEYLPLSELQATGDVMDTLREHAYTLKCGTDEATFAEVREWWSGRGGKDYYLEPSDLTEDTPCGYHWCH